jgi:hypothetical protein
VQGQLPASVAADRNHDHGLPRARSGGSDLADDRVQTIGKTSERCTTAVAAEDVVAKLAASLLELHGEARRRR